MMNSIITKTLLFFKSHLVVLSYFIFFVLALLPTMFPFFGKLGVYYKIAVLLMFTAFLIIFIFKKRIKIPIRYLIIPATIFAVYGLYYLAVLPTYFTFIAPDYSYINGTTITIVTSFKTRVDSLINIFNICYFATLFLIISPSLKLNTTDLIYFSVLISLLTFIACIYSIRNFKSAEYESLGLISFLGNKNTFGQFLMVCVFTNLFSVSISKRIISKIIFGLLGIGFLVFSFLSKSSTASILSLLIFVVGVVYLVTDCKKINIYFKIAFFILLGTIFALLLVSPYIPFLSDTKIGEMVKSLYDKFFSFKGKSFLDAFSGRGKLWVFGGYILRPNYLMLGYGNATLEEIVYRCTLNYFTTRELTNQYLTIINAYGIIGCIFYLIIFVYLFYKSFKSKNKFSEWTLLFFLVYLQYGLFESLLLFESFSGSLLLTPVLVVPAVYFKTEKHTKNTEAISNE